MSTNDDIKSTIENSTQQRPESLSRENVVELIKSKGIAPEKNYHKTILFRKILSIAAAVAVLIGVAAAYRYMDFDLNKANETMGAVSTSMPTVMVPATSSVLGATAQTSSSLTDEPAEDYSEIEKYFLSLNKSLMKSYKTVDDYSDTEKSISDVTTEGAMSVNEETSVHGETNTQVNGVDEADILKNDGKYLYTVTDGETLSIVDVAKMKIMSRIRIESKGEDKYIRVLNIYLNCDTLVAVCQLSHNYNKMPLLNGVYFTCECYYGYADTDTISIIYDISDRAKPKEVRRFEQDGYQISSRMVGSVLYSASQYTVDIYQNDEQTLKDNCVPKVDSSRILPEDILWKQKDGENQNIYIILTAFDTAQPDSKVESISRLGIGSNVYCTTSNMYLFESKWYTDADCTEISSFKLDGTKLSYKTTGSVMGTALSQYSLDEYNGYLRIATTSYDYTTYKDVSSVYVLDENLKQVGAVKNLANDEQIKSVRFTGDTAYVVTFRNTDPLFVIDLSDPTAPKAVGKVNLPGFSSYLHPVGNGLIIGVGYDGSTSDADYSSVKVSLFNVKDPKKPVEVDSYVVECASTDINSDPKAFMYYPEKNIVGIPMIITKQSSDHPVQSLMVLQISEAGLELFGGFVHSSDDCIYNCQYFRGTYIGNDVYTVTQSLIKCHSLETKEVTGTVSIEGFAENNYDDVYTTLKTYDIIN